MLVEHGIIYKVASTCNGSPPIPSCWGGDRYQSGDGGGGLREVGEALVVYGTCASGADRFWVHRSGSPSAAPLGKKSSVILRSDQASSASPAWLAWLQKKLWVGPVRSGSAGPAGPAGAQKLVPPGIAPGGGPPPASWWWGGGRLEGQLRTPDRMFLSRPPQALDGNSGGSVLNMNVFLLYIQNETSVPI